MICQLLWRGQHWQRRPWFQTRARAPEGDWRRVEWVVRNDRTVAVGRTAVLAVAPLAVLYIQTHGTHVGWMDSPELPVTKRLRQTHAADNEARATASQARAKCRRAAPVHACVGARHRQQRAQAAPVEPCSRTRTRRSRVITFRPCRHACRTLVGGEKTQPQGSESPCRRAPRGPRAGSAGLQPDSDTFTPFV